MGHLPSPVFDFLPSMGSILRCPQRWAKSSRFQGETHRTTWGWGDPQGTRDGSRRESHVACRKINHLWMVFPFCCIRFCDGFSTAVFDGGYHAMHMSNMTTFAKTSICAVHLDSTEEDDALLLNIPAAIGDESISW